MPKATLDSLLAEIAAGTLRPIYLVSGDLVVAEPQAVRLAEALAERAGCDLTRARRPPGLASILTDLRTYSLFSTAKIVLVVDSAIFADRSAAAELIDQTEGALPLADPSAELGGKAREAASRLLQALHVFGIVVDAGPPDEVVASIPGWALQGGKAYRKKKPRGRPAKERKALQQHLAALLEAALRDGLVGFAESDLPALGDLLDGGLPDGHSLVLCEASVADEHPLVERLTEAGVRVELGKVEAGRGGAWDGLAPLVEELCRESGVGIERDALQELARRTLRQTGDWKNRGVDAESTARLAGEYRKLAGQVGEGGRITRRHVHQSVEDRGEEDVWQILDALGAGRGDEALARFERLIAGADDALAARLSFFALLAGFCRQLTAVAGIARLCRVQPGERNYNRFKNSLAPKLQGDLPYDAPNPIAKIHPFRLHRAYMAASLMPRDELARLPWRVLETETRIKGDSSDADTAVAWLLAHLARLARGGR